jgi:hypothetical protein
VVGRFLEFTAATIRGGNAAMVYMIPIADREIPGDQYEIGLILAS